MQIKSKKENGILILTLNDERLDAQLAVSFKDKLSEFINSGNRAIVINLSSVNFIDSSGLGAIVSCLKLMGSKGRLALFGLSPPVASMFQLTRMDRVFALYTTEEQAIEAVQL
jgi:anti-sigma B factor antagonist